MATPKYTQKHFRDVAEILRVHFNRAGLEPRIRDLDAKVSAIESITLEFADLFARVNPKFDRDLFLAVVRGDKPVNARPSKKAAPVEGEPLTADEQFFYDNAGSSYDPATETFAEGCVRGARKLAAAEQHAHEQGWIYLWEDDGCACSICDTKHEQICLLYDKAGTFKRLLASLGGICGATPEYRRVVEAELACEAQPDVACKPR